MATASVQPAVQEQVNPLVAGLERLPVHPTAVTIFGGTGDLAHRKILPALYNLAHDGSLPERFELMAIARSPHSDDEFRDLAGASIERFSRTKPDPDVLGGLLADVRYLPGSFDDADVYRRIGQTLTEFEERDGQPLTASSTWPPLPSSSRSSPKRSARPTSLKRKAWTRAS